MQAVGIVAEYNPFHNGHKYHIDQTKAQLPDADGVIAVMSGNFTQRGEPAIFDKWTRAQAALYGGADLVLELPTAFATRSAGYFAEGAVLTLASTGVVSHLSCGVESSDSFDMLKALQRISQVLAEEPLQYRSYLYDNLAEGMSYPAARQAALIRYGITEAEWLDTPNNILALEYLQTITNYNLSISPMFIPRAGVYHSESLPQDPLQFASATAIRKHIMQNNSTWKAHMPELSAQLLQECLEDGIPPMQIENFAQILLFLLRRSSPQELYNIVDMIEGIENRIYDAAQRDNSYTMDDLCMAIKSKRFTYTRIQRTLLHILLGFTTAYEAKAPEYIRVLGFNATGQKLLKEMKKKAQLPIVIRPARQKNELSPKGQKLLELDIRATNLYFTGYTNPRNRTMNLDLLQMPIQV